MTIEKKCENWKKKEELVGKRCPREVELVTRRLSGVIVEAFSRADINVATRQAVVLRRSVIRLLTQDRREMPASS